MHTSGGTPLRPGASDRWGSSVADVAWCLHLDLLAAEVVTGLDAAGVPSILLKGPAIARWLYPGGGRVYGDIDLLVEPGLRPQAEAVLARLGFVDTQPGESPLECSDRSRSWARGEHDTIDLHVSLEGADKRIDRAWGALFENTEEQRIGGRDITVLNPAGRALHIALHACQHGMHEAQPVGDLERALGRLEPEVWVDAYTLARRLRAVDAFGAGLRL